jgi:hypothetical protein
VAGLCNVTIPVQALHRAHRDVHASLAPVAENARALVAQMALLARHSKDHVDDSKRRNGEPGQNEEQQQQRPQPQNQSFEIVSGYALTDDDADVACNSLYHPDAWTLEIHSAAAAKAAAAAAAGECTVCGAIPRGAFVIRAELLRQLPFYGSAGVFAWHEFLMRVLTRPEHAWRRNNLRVLQCNAGALRVTKRLHAVDRGARASFDHSHSDHLAFGATFGVRRVLYRLGSGGDSVHYMRCAANGYSCAHHKDAVPWQPGYPVCCSTLATTLLFEVLDFLEQHSGSSGDGGSGWLTMGSALGAHRNGRAVPWAYDHDLVVRSAAYNAFVAANGAWTSSGDGGARRVVRVGTKTVGSAAHRYTKVFALGGGAQQRLARSTSSSSSPSGMPYKWDHEEGYYGNMTLRLLRVLGAVPRSVRYNPCVDVKPVTRSVRGFRATLEGRNVWTLGEEHVQEMYTEAWRTVPPGYAGVAWCDLRMGTRDPEYNATHEARQQSCPVL